MSHDSTTTPAGSLRMLSAADVEQLADWREAIDALRDAYGRHLTDDMVPMRSMARDTGIWLRGMTAISTSGKHVGAKMITVNRQNVKASYTVLLIDREVATLKALVDGSHITGLRTAATSAVFVDQAAPQRPVRVAVVGSGFEAYNHFLAVSKIREVASATVFSPRETSRQAFADRAAAETGLVVVPAASAEEAVRGADVVLCAARSRDESPTLSGAWVGPGTTVVSIGSTLPEQREVGTDLLAKAARIVADMVEEVSEDTGDFLAAKADGIDFEGRLFSLADIVSGRQAARTGEDEIVVYKSVGSALQDIVVAEQLLASAERLGIGTVVGSPIQPIDK
ncbi:ornithine cyclodeaminase/alanine dehydrogenase [Raineyella antarctica]|uniref:Ornithine cyclodeaminase/alanine dehydrogenase n=1 Tax=Raineyella antarctica TaxID=1577474 RepID=A0A1G6H252_9ACTN|nr:ornithine cyclodeaminase family protein [Raineyella antarctica]SDB87985.1 ornithine cyclodeaminase/alanine dehydrogenase [Raineyella antarctica]